MSASVAGKIVPCHAGTVVGAWRRRRLVTVGAAGLPSGKLAFVGSCRSATSSLLLLWAGAAACRTVHGLLTSACTSGKLCRSSKVGFHVLPSGGPNSACVFMCRASSVVVYL